MMHQCMVDYQVWAYTIVIDLYSSHSRAFSLKKCNLLEHEDPANLLRLRLAKNIHQNTI